MHKANYNLELIIRGKRMLIRGIGNNSISLEVDVTPLWHFFKDFERYEKNKHLLKANTN